MESEELDKQQDSLIAPDSKTIRCKPVTHTEDDRLFEYCEWIYWPVLLGELK